MKNVPFRSSTLTVLPEWIDYNGHLNMAYYSVLMDQGLEQAYPLFGFGPDYLATTGCTTYVAEFHVCYVRELHVNDPVQITFQMLDMDEKRFHGYQEIWHNDGWLAATGEAMTLHVDQSGPRVAPMPDDVFARIKTMHDAHARLPKPERMGKSIGIKRK